jgi:hypothetical protein
VKCPDQFLLFPFEIREEHFQITVMTMYIMQMDNIGLDSLQFSNHFARRFSGIKAIIPQHS